ncbi:MAG: DUF4388 domain-containing protein [Desulfuromonadaceae bacterium]|nr:DUF4388 domain-containing protein [Desulfuromonadaceae bacterium]
MTQQALSTEQLGFVGAVSGMSLADIIQVKGGNRYSGCLVVDHRGDTGVIFFRDGDVVHAEQGDRNGEEAFYAVMGWADGTFRSEPKVSTTSRTINQSVGYLILEALRRMDEAKNSLRQGRRSETLTSSEDTGMSVISNKLKAISGVEYSVVMTKDGQVVDDTSSKAEALSGYGLYLALFAGEISSQFGIGELKSIAVQGTDRHLFLLGSKKHHLCVSTDTCMPVTMFESEIKRILADK